MITDKEYNSISQTIAEGLGLPKDTPRADSIKVLTERKAKLENMKAEIESIKAEIDDRRRQRALVEIDKVKKLTARHHAANQEIDRQEKELVRRESDTVIDHAMNDGRVIPRDRYFWKNKYMQDPTGTLEILKYIRPRPDIFKELGSSGDGPDTERDPGKELVRLAEEMQGKRQIEYGAAFELVSKDNPELVERYQTQRAGPRQ